MPGSPAASLGNVLLIHGHLEGRRRRLLSLLRVVRHRIAWLHLRYEHTGAVCFFGSASASSGLKRSANIKKILAERRRHELMDVRDESWFFQEMSPLLATELLKKMPNNEGAFLVRCFKKRLALSYVWQQTVKHCWITSDPSGIGCYLLPQERFDSVQELVQHYGSTPCSGLAGLRLQRYPLAEDVENFLRLPPADIEIGSDGRSCSLVNPLTTLEHGRFGHEAVSAINRRYNSHEVTACLRNAASMLIVPTCRVLRWSG
uniref:SH2 domain-containing protein n=2 Tax=Macrostomum lignano TaxID=282301 RepID=A0A1I8IYL6_9PLAT